MGLSELKRYAWRGMAAAYAHSGAPRVRHRGTVAILTYHRVLSEDDLSAEMVQPGMYVRADAFQMHMEFLRERFEILSLTGLLERWRNGSWNRATACCVVTFDDGWIDNYRNAFPILKRCHVPATVFLPTDFIGTAKWFWPEQLMYLMRALDAPSCRAERRAACHAALREGIESAWNHAERWPFTEPISAKDADALIEACKALPPSYLHDLLARLGKQFEVELPDRRVVMNWEEVREMSRHGITFGSHSCSHRLLDRLSREECRTEITASYQRLLKSGAIVTPVFCYPNGNFNAATKELVKEAGYQAAVSCNVGLEGERPSDLFALRRISLHHDLSETPSLLALAVSGLR